MFEKLKDSIIQYIYNISQQPVKLHELLEAKRLYDDGMKIEDSKLGFRLKKGRAYVVFLILIHIFIVPIAFVTHHLFILLDCHAAIIIAIIFTAFLFGLFSCFKDWTRDRVSMIRIKQMWRLHFPHFPYDEFEEDISKIYKVALEEDIKNIDLERYILDSLSNT